MRGEKADESSEIDNDQTKQNENTEIAKDGADKDENLLTPNGEQEKFKSFEIATTGGEKKNFGIPDEGGEKLEQTRISNHGVEEPKWQLNNNPDSTYVIDMPYMSNIGTNTHHNNYLIIKILEMKFILYSFLSHLDNLFPTDFQNHYFGNCDVFPSQGDFTYNNITPFSNQKPSGKARIIADEILSVPYFGAQSTTSDRNIGILSNNCRS